MLVPEASRLAWLEGRHIAERAVWVSQFREGDESLGQVVQSVMEKRGAHWDTPIQSMVGRSSPAFPPQPPAGRDTRKHEQGQQQDRQQPLRRRSRRQFLHPPIQKRMTPSTVAVALQDGKPLCPELTKAVVAPKGHSAPRVCTGVLKSCGRRPCLTVLR